MPEGDNEYEGTTRDGVGMALIAARYYGALLKNGVPADAAATLTASYIRDIISVSAGKTI